MVQKSRSWVKAVSVLGILVLLAGCSTPPEGTPVKGGPQPTADASIAKELLPFYEQKVAWETCGKNDRTYCANIEVPADWSKPAGDRLKIAIAYREADSGSPLGSIVTNPGGPGVPGTKSLIEGYVGNHVLKGKFNFVSFDPRGVGKSEPKVKCLDKEEKDEWYFGGALSAEPGTAAGLAEVRAAHKKFIDGCVKNTGPNLQFVDTISVARDMDVIRAVFGDSKINYLGVSYGTYLGSTYAALFPKRVGRMALDAVVDPTVRVESGLEQVKGFDKTFKHFLEDCVGKSKKDCPLTGDLASAESQVADLLLSMEKKPLKTDSGRDLTPSAAATGISAGLYSTAYWPELRTALKEALNGDGTTLLKYAGMTSDAHYSINCADYSPSIDEGYVIDQAYLVAEGKRMLAASKVFGRYNTHSLALVCEHWPYPGNSLKSYAAAGSDKILVIGTTGDPSTPYQQAVSLATKVLANAQLVTLHDDMHGAFLSSVCVTKTVEDYFIKGVVPAKDPQCKDTKK